MKRPSLLALAILATGPSLASAQSCANGTCGRPVYYRTPARLTAGPAPAYYRTPAVRQVARPAYRATAPTSNDPLGPINALRARHGLRALAWDGNLAAWAASNNAEQARSGLGHHVVPGCGQCSGWNFPTPQYAADWWYGSPGHNRIMMDPGATRAGLAFNGAYSTLNVSR